MWSKLLESVHSYLRLRGGRVKTSVSAANEPVRLSPKERRQRALKRRMQAAMDSGACECALLPGDAPPYVCGELQPQSVKTAARLPGSAHGPAKLSRDIKDSQKRQPNSLDAIPGEFQYNELRQTLYKHFAREMADYERMRLYKQGGVTAVREEVKRRALDCLDRESLETLTEMLRVVKERRR